MSEASVPDWISSIAAASGALAVILGLLRADKKIDEFQTNTRNLKQAEAAADLIAIALNVEDAFRDIRNPFDSGVSRDGAWHEAIRKRMYDRVNRHNDLFQKLREAQFRQRALIGDEEINRAVIELFNARSEVAFAIGSLYANEESSSKEPSNEEREASIALRRVLYASGSEKDVMGKTILESVRKIEDRLKPFARLEVRVGK